MSTERIPVEADLVREHPHTWVVVVHDRQYSVEKVRAYYEDGVLYIDEKYAGSLGMIIRPKRTTQ